MKKNYCYLFICMKLTISFVCVGLKNLWIMIEEISTNATIYGPRKNAYFVLFKNKINSLTC